MSADASSPPVSVSMISLRLGTSDPDTVDAAPGCPDAHPANSMTAVAAMQMILRIVLVFITSAPS